MSKLKHKVKLQNQQKTFIFALAFVSFFIFAVIGYRTYVAKKPIDTSISSFKDCVKAGNPASQEHPMTCRTSDGRVFSEKLESVDDPYAQENTERGRIVKIDYLASATGGEVQVQIENEQKIISGYYLASDESNCDRSVALAIKNREFKVGDQVEIRAKLSGLKAGEGEVVDSIGFQRVCDEGTYIKKLDPSAESGDNSFQSEFTSVQGTIVSLDLESMDNRGTAGSMIIRSANGDKYEINIGSKKYLDGPSLCDRPDLPSNLSNNKQVEVRGEQHVDPNGSKSLTVCARETYVKLK